MAPNRSVKILLTGTPGCGKTTAVKQIVLKLPSLKIAGFYTEEIRENKIRKGFRWTTFDGKSGILAHVDIKGAAQVSKYGVDVEGFEKLVVPVLNAGRGDTDLFVIDEIGRMECFSEQFVNSIRRLFDSERSVLASVAIRGTGLISEVKSYPGVRLFQLTRKNRDKTISEIAQTLLSLKTS